MLQAHFAELGLVAPVAGVPGSAGCKAAEESLRPSRTMKQAVSLAPSPVLRKRSLLHSYRILALSFSTHQACLVQQRLMQRASGHRRGAAADDVGHARRGGRHADGDDSQRRHDDGSKRDRRRHPGWWPPFHGRFRPRHAPVVQLSGEASGRLLRMKSVIQALSQNSVGTPCLESSETGWRPPLRWRPTRLRHSYDSQLVLSVAKVWVACCQQIRLVFLCY